MYLQNWCTYGIAIVNEEIALSSGPNHQGIFFAQMDLRMDNNIFAVFY